MQKKILPASSTKTNTQNTMPPFRRSTPNLPCQISKPKQSHYSQIFTANTNPQAKMAHKKSHCCRLGPLQVH